MSDEIKIESVSTRYGHPDFYKLLDQMAELHSRKNHDYAGTSDPLKNLRACNRLELNPFIGVMVRLQDKWSRIEEFVKSKTLLVKNESVEDTLMDNAVYSLLAIILLREQKKSTDILACQDEPVRETEKIQDTMESLAYDDGKWYCSNPTCCKRGFSNVAPDTFYCDKHRKDN